VKRRNFITLLGSAAAWPLAARAQQQPERMRRIGVLMSQSADHPDALAQVSAFAQGLQERGWTVGGNARIDYRWGAGDLDRFRKYAAELVALAPDVILATAGSIVGALQQVSRTVPIVFVTTIDPVGGGWVESLARPGGNATGFTAYEFSMSGKWLELLKEIAPRVTRVAVIRDPSVPAGSGGFAAIQTVAPLFGVELTPIGVRDAGEIERGITAFARGSNGGLIMVGPPSSVQLHRDLIIALAAQHRLPAVYGGRFYVTIGGLLAYVPDPIDQYRRAAGYVDRILKGEKPADRERSPPCRSHRGKADVAVLRAVSGNDCRTHLTARCSESANCGVAPSRTRHSDPIGNLGPGLASNREFALARRIDKLNWCLLGKTDIDEIARIIDLELKRLPR
jgi:putative tryptophan/tyrosine transport system substrate-binding protein